jgi:hypothetical protein
MAAKLETKRHKGHWEVFGLDEGPMGPYGTKAEAEEDRIGVQRFIAADAKGGKMAESFIFGKGGRP